LDPNADPKATEHSMGRRASRQRMGQRALIQPGGAGEKRRANADDSATSFDGGVGGANAPMKKAARTPSSKPKTILRTFGRMTQTRRPAVARRGWEGRARIVVTSEAMESVLSL
jgi:hypothetical protein